MYYLFAGYEAYPQGGFDDCRGEFDTEADAKAQVGGNWDWAHVVLVTDSGWSIVARYSYRGWEAA